MGIRLDEIEFPGDECEFSPNHSHHFSKIIGDVWRCKYCWAGKYLPGSFGKALEFSLVVRRKGMRAAYRRLIEFKPRTVSILEQLRGFRITRRVADAETIEKLEFLMLLDFAKDKKAIAGIRKEQSHIVPQPDAKKITEELTEMSMSFSGRKVPNMIGRS